ncbi:MAG: sulfatase-like hydrolase/transferase [Planctomycetales bacterium]|nr:sulfatase-like hydrolase/transferase [Planctomycetales bacterium]
MFSCFCRVHLRWMLFVALVNCFSPGFSLAAQPNIVLVMADDQGWGETGYIGHPVLKTPNLDQMASQGLRLDRFYAGAPVCSPTRATVLTGRTNNRTGVQSHGYALRLQEPTLAEALRKVGYVTGHFGKWHLNGYRGPGAPILKDDDHHPGHFGFDQWLSVTNFFDRNPILSRQGSFEEFQGDSSEIVVGEALKFISANCALERPSFTVIWFGSPHSPFVAADQDRADFSALPDASQHHYGEIVALDRAVGNLRSGIRDLGIAENTLVWYCSDNGGLPNIKPSTVGHLRGNKGTLYEGGLRVPAIIEWPSQIKHPRISSYPACTMDIAPTIAEICSLSATDFIQTQDGLSLTSLFNREQDEARGKPIPFNYNGGTALVDNNWKLIESKGGSIELFDLSNDPSEQKNLWPERPSASQNLEIYLRDFQNSLAASVDGKDYPEQQVNPGEPEPRNWYTTPEYEPYRLQWQDRPEFRPYYQRAQ